MAQVLLCLLDMMELTSQHHHQETSHPLSVCGGEPLSGGRALCVQVYVTGLAFVTNPAQAAHIRLLYFYLQLW